MSHLIDLTGQRFGRLVVKERGETKNGKTHWICDCDCGNETVVYYYQLKTGKTLSCGCYRKEKARETGKLIKTHGMTNTRLYRIWDGMRRRCKVNPLYKNVSVCKEWEKFEEFYLWAIKAGYSDKLTIDRIDNFGNYSPENCRWATYKEQENNRTNNRICNYGGNTYTLSELSEKLGIGSATLAWRIDHGWSENDLSLFVNLGNSKIRRLKNA